MSEREKHYATLPFRLATISSHGSGPRSVVRFECHECGATRDTPTSSARVINPEAQCERARRDGWAADIRSHRATCPACIEAHKAARKGESPNPKPAESQSMNATTKPVAPQAPAATFTLAPLTQDQRFRVRAMLDTHFDDAKGCYLDGYSDLKVAEHVGVPRIHVETIREAAFGPIRCNPEVEALKREVEELTLALDRIGKRVTEATTRLAALG